MASRFSAQMSGQMPGWPAAMRVMSRKPPAARRSRARVLLGPLVGQAHQRGRGEVGHVGHHGHQRVVALGRQRHHLGAERRHHRPHRRVGRGVGVGRRRQHPHGALEQVGVGAVDALLLASRPSGGRRRSGGRPTAVDDRRLHAADVGDDAAPRVEARRGLVGDGADRRGDEGQLGVGVVADRVEGAELERPRRPGRRRGRAGDVPAPRPQGQPDRAADEPGADDAARRGASAGQVVAQALGALEVHVVQLGRGPLGRRGASAPGCSSGRAAVDVELPGADQRHVAEAEGRGRRWPGTSSGCRRWR